MALCSRIHFSPTLAAGLKRKHVQTNSLPLGCPFSASFHDEICCIIILEGLKDLFGKDCKLMNANHAFLHGNHENVTPLKALEDAFGKDCKLMEIELINNGLGDAGAEAIAAALETNTETKVVTFENNLITDGGAQAILDGLKANAGTQMTQVVFDGTNTVSKLMKDRIEALLTRRSTENIMNNPNMVDVVSVSFSFSCCQQLLHARYKTNTHSHTFASHFLQVLTFTFHLH
jgi:hypothetical protein